MVGGDCEREVNQYTTRPGQVQGALVVYYCVIYIYYLGNLT